MPTPGPATTGAWTRCGATAGRGTAGPVVARAQPRVPALCHGPGEGRGGDRRDRRAGALYPAPARLRPLAGPLSALGTEGRTALGADSAPALSRASGTWRFDLWVRPRTPTVRLGGRTHTSLTRRSL